jgi:DNA (cytosine-5)-methyltransferase 1
MIQLQEPSEELPVVVDMFCGAGGESQGIKQASMKAKAEIKMFAINHWARAIETHRANFPFAEHICRDVADINPSGLVPGREVKMLWASVECTHFSNARGGKPMNDQSRCTAFTILDWLDKLTVDRLIIENVPEFERWGPLDPETNRPVPEQKGETFKAYIGMIRSLGYVVDWKVLNAADYGAPTTRRRLFVQAVRTNSEKVILWPKASHAQSVSPIVPGNLPSWIPASSIIDWTLPTQIIDERSKPLVANTMKRILRGIEKYWGNYAKPFLMRYTNDDNLDDTISGSNTSKHRGPVQPLIMCIGQTSSRGRVRSIDEPLATVVTKEEACLIEPLILPYRASGKGAIGLVEPLIMNYYGTGICHPVSHPIPSVTTKDRFALITPENVRIGFRMLKPHELAAAQSFPRRYIFTGNKGEVVKQIGNAVCPVMAEALTTDYMKELAGVLA